MPRQSVSVAATARATVSPSPVVSPTASARTSRKLTRLTEVRAEIGRLEAEKRTLSAEVLPLVEREGEEDLDGKMRLEDDGYRYQIVRGEATELDSRLLLQLGVSARIIKKATRVTPFAYVRADRKKEQE